MGFKQQRNDNAKETPFMPRFVRPRGETLRKFRTPLYELRLPELTNARVENSFEPFARGRIGEDATGEKISAKGAMSGEHIRAEGVLYLSQRRLTRFDELAGEKVGINNCNTA